MYYLKQKIADRDEQWKQYLLDITPAMIRRRMAQATTQSAAVLDVKHCSASGACIWRHDRTCFKAEKQKFTHKTVNHRNLCVADRHDGAVHSNCFTASPASTVSDSIVASISACHAEDPGSIPGGGVLSFGIHAQVRIPHARTVSPKPNVQNANPRPKTPEQNCNEVSTLPSFKKFWKAELCIRTNKQLVIVGQQPSAASVV